MIRIPGTVTWGVGLAFATAIISGMSVYLNGRFISLFDDPTLLAAVRNGIVGLVLVVVAARAGSLRRVGALSARQRLGLLAIGVVGGGIPFALFFNGLALSTSPAAAVIHKTLFLWVAILAVPFLGERIGVAQIAALAVLLVGTVVLAPAGSLGTGLGEAMIVAATGLWAVEVVIARRLLRGDVPATLAAAARMTIGALCLIALVAVGGGLAGLLRYGPEQWLAVVLTGVLLTGYVTTWYAALQRAPAATVTSILVVGAVVTTALAAWTTGGLPAAPSLAGNLLLLLGVALAMAGMRGAGTGSRRPSQVPVVGGRTAPGA
jgi:drug/metabolite transporter (DMT)-like permease